MDIDVAWSGNNKCFNCGRDHFVKECKKSMLQCGKCKFLGGSHKKDCSCQSKDSRQAQGAKKEEDAATSWNEDKSTKKEKEDKGKGQD